MSWIQKNYEKAALGAGVVVGLGLAFFGWQKLASVDETFSSQPKGGGSNDPAVTGAGAVARAQSSFEIKRAWAPGEDEGRTVDLFTGVPLFVNRDNLQTPVDLEKSPPVHDPIPNRWWVEHRIDPGYADSPHRDEDGDGFSNLEEFKAETNPTDPRSFPQLITKLIFVSEKSVTWVLRPGFEAEGGAYTFEYNDSLRRAARAGAASPVAPGELFFDAEPILNRFKLLGAEKRMEMNESIQLEQEITIVRVEDQKPNKKGVVYEIPAQFNRNRANEFTQFDRTAVLRLDALGLGDQDFEVEEGTAFGLPQDAAEKNYLLKEVTPEKIVVEYKDSEGAIQTTELNLAQ